MNLDSVRNAKKDALAVVSQMVGNDAFRRKLGIRAQSIEIGSKPRTIALGVARAGAGEYSLAVRVQNPLLLEGQEIAAIRHVAKGEVDVKYIGQVQKRQAPWYQQQCRPVRIGCSVAHFKVTAGSVGGFAQSSAQAPMVLSNNHVLANENDAAAGDAILQPGPFDGGQNPGDRIGTLTQFVPLNFTAVNTVDCAVATLDGGIAFDSKNLDLLGQLSGVRTSSVDVGDVVAKIGRTTGVTHGTVTAIELDNVTVGYDNGNATFNGQIEIEGTGSQPFSRGGDSGSLIIDQNNLAAALLFAGTDTGGTNGMGVTYANPIEVVLSALGITMIV
ncbi:MAG TPA: hypothetical protein VKV39_20770 [Candidatus Sulfotelmatobacter sp.]|nr:hypothetical protein [Candidatus Sulfotelmatobacter sp.]